MHQKIRLEGSGGTGEKNKRRRFHKKGQREVADKRVANELNPRARPEKRWCANRGVPSKEKRKANEKVKTRGKTKKWVQRGKTEGWNRRRQRGKAVRAEGEGGLAAREKEGKKKKKPKKKKKKRAAREIEWKGR